MGKENNRWCQWKCEKKVLMFKIKSFLQKKKKSVISHVCFVFFWPVCYWEVIFFGIIQTGLEHSVP